MEIKPGPLGEILSSQELELLYNATKKRIKAVKRGTEEHIIDWFYHVQKNILTEVSVDPSLSASLDKILKEVPTGMFLIFLDENFKGGSHIGHSTLPGPLDIGKNFMYFKKR